jgi:hypothetical protein
MSLWNEEMKRIRALKRTFYKAPLPLKRQRTTAPREPHGSPRSLSEEELFVERCRWAKRALEMKGAL